MSKVYVSAVVIIPPKELWPPIQEIRIKYDRHINRWMPHITLLYPFRSESEFDLMAEKFIDVCQKFSPFEITLKEIDFFYHGRQHYTIWIKPYPSKLIIELQQLILKVVPDCNDVNLHKTGFVPHLSLGQINGKNSTLSLLEEIRQRWRETCFLLNHIYLIAREPMKNSKFEIKKRVYLGK